MSLFKPKTKTSLTKSTDPVRNSLNRLLWRRGLVLIPLVVVFFGFSQPVYADCPLGLCDFDNENTAFGFALENNSTGMRNTAIGFQALELNTTGSDNTANGARALFKNTTGFDNTAIGFEALENNTTGSNTTAIGFEALAFNTTGSDNTATGFEALSSNTTGSDNTATGFEALSSNTTGSDNTASGFKALLKYLLLTQPVPTTRPPVLKRS